MDLEKVIQERCSIRHFKDEKIKKEELDKMLKAALMAPTAKNLQPFRIYIIDSKEGIEKLDTLTRCRYNAPHVLLFTYNEDEMWINDIDKEINSGIEDVSIAATFLMLEAYNIGIDTCWVNLFNNKELEKAFNLDKKEHSVLLMPFGYRRDGDKASHLHYDSKELKDLVKTL